MGSVGDCCDNAVIESFGSRMQVELLDRRGWQTRAELASTISKYQSRTPVRRVSLKFTRRVVGVP
jgi:hypothetical protein